MSNVSVYGLLKGFITPNSLAIRCAEIFSFSGSKISDPEELVISREEFIDIEEKMGEILSDLEWKVLMSYLDGKSYQEIAVELTRHVKSIDNALQRVKRKLERYLDNRADDLDIRGVYKSLAGLNKELQNELQTYDDTCD